MGEGSMMEGGIPVAQWIVKSSDADLQGVTEEIAYVKALNDIDLLDLWNDHFREKVDPVGECHWNEKVDLVPHGEGAVMIQILIEGTFSKVDVTEPF